MYKFLLLYLFLLISSSVFGQDRKIIELESWKFKKADIQNAEKIDFPDLTWENVKVPHDWAIKGPFDKEIDKQVVRIEQNGEEIASEKTGRTGALPFIGVAWYRTTVEIEDFTDDNQALLTFDGAMSQAEVFVNGVLVGKRAYGYSYFYFDITEYIKANEKLHIAVKLENQPFSSRWYPGAGLYRKVQIMIKNKQSFQHWGHRITTPYISSEIAKVNIQSKVQGENVKVQYTIRDAEGNKLVQEESKVRFGETFEAQIPIHNPILWDTDNPYLYTAEMQLMKADQVLDTEMIKFGIRAIKYSSDRGFELNGIPTKFKGVCLHHDLGPLGAAVNKSALRRQLKILKDLGCNAIRSAHNMPSLEQLELCDEMGFLFLAESFDEWKKPKVQNGYNQFFDQWAEKDVVNLVQATKNHPCIVMWSAGNEVPDQWGSEGVKRLHWLQNIFHREDPSRPVTVGMDQVNAVMESGFGAILDVPGLNYRVHLYEEAQERFPQGILLGSETASTVSSRGVYHFPVKTGADIVHEDLQSSSYDVEYCSWSNLPEDDFIMQDDKPWVLGEFVWTGFDYLGEPTPYDSYWPSRSSYFGICDLAGLPKDRYYLYRSRWNTIDETLHILPHWNWEGKEGDTIPVFVYTNYPSAELFINGISQGIQTKDLDSKMDRYRLRWMHSIYQPGVVKVVAYDEKGILQSEKVLHTAGKANHIALSLDRQELTANGEDLCYITASILDKNGRLCPTASNQLQVQVSGQGQFEAICNGDPTSLEMFHEPTMKVFSGQLVFIIKSNKSAGEINITVKSEGLKMAQSSITSFE